MSAPLDANESGRSEAMGTLSADSVSALFACVGGNKPPVHGAPAPLTPATGEGSARVAGFTLLELVITVSVLGVVMLLSFAAVEAATSSASLAQASGAAQGSVRNVIRALTSELQLSAKTGNDALDPVLEPVTIRQNPVTGSPVEITYQLPLDQTGLVWSRLVRCRYVNEDANDNGHLDAGEDVDGDGTLSRRLVRMQDRNGDNDTDDAGETVAVGGANNLDDVQFAREGDVIVATLTATEFVGRRRSRPVTATVTSRIYLLN